MEGTKIELPHWFSIMEDFCLGLNALEISDKHRLNYKTVQGICHKLRHAIQDYNSGVLDGEVEFDEFIFGPDKGQNLRLGWKISTFNSEEKKKEENDPSYTKQNYNNQKVLVTIVQRNGKAIVKPIGASKEAITSENIRKVIQKHISSGAALFMDSHPTHLTFETDGTFAEVYLITHTEKTLIFNEDGTPSLNEKGKQKKRVRKVFKNKKGIHTNNVEGLNARLNRFLKRYKKHSYKYAQLYYNQFVFLYNCKRDGLDLLGKINVLLKDLEKPITMKELQNRDNPYPEKIHVENPKKFSGEHSRKKIIVFTDFNFF